MAPTPFRCAEAAQERGDLLLGTAPTAAALLLIEHPGPWRFDALTGAGWGSEVTHALAAAIGASRARLLLIRRPGRQRNTSERSWAVVRIGIGTRWGTWRAESELVAAAHALGVSETDTSPLAPDPILLVCAHGVHDACCAIRGRPVAAALAERWPEQTWECTHVGGDRFAANLIVLPDGTYYGGLDAGSGPRVAAEHLDGRVAVDWLRGSMRWPPVAQVAVGAIQRRRGPCDVDDITAETWSPRGPGRWSVTVVGPAGLRHQVTVVGEPQPAAVLTCAATQPTSATAYRAESVTPST